MPVIITRIEDFQHRYAAHVYSIRINREEIAQVRHVYNDGLAELLKAAAAAVEKARD